MTNNIKLLPLVGTLRAMPEYVQGVVQSYARANVAHATAPLQAEIEALRAENERLRESRNEYYYEAKGSRLANSDLRRRNAELQARVAELERFRAVVQTAMQIHVIDEDAIEWINQQLTFMRGEEAQP